MSGDRYLKVVLTVIALELLWIGIRDAAPPVAAQARGQAAAQAAPAPTPVVITGVQVSPGDGGYLPVAVLGSVREAGAAAPFVQPLQAEIVGARPIRVEAPVPLRVEIEGPVTVEAARPLPVENVSYTGTARPGEVIAPRAR